MKEIKATPHHIKSIVDRSVTGIFSVFGNKDRGYWMSDIVHTGAFKKTLREQKGKIMHLWQHDFMSPPIAVIEEIKELSREELPKDILKDYPEAKGGMEVTRRYLDTPRANEVLTNIKEGVPLQMSFGYDAVKYDFEEDPDDSNKTIRNLREVKLWETSDVLWGANEATLASKVLLEQARHDPEFLTQLKALLEPPVGTLLNANAEPEPQAHSEDYSSVLSAIKSLSSLPDLLQAQKILYNLGKGN